MKKTDLEKNKGLKINNDLKQSGATRAGSVPKGKRPQEGGAKGLLGKLLGKAVQSGEKGNG